jgi:hypothetical protein
LACRRRTERPLDRLGLLDDDGPAAFSFIQNAIADVAAALKVDTSGGGILGFLGSIWVQVIVQAAVASRCLRR